MIICRSQFPQADINLNYKYHREQKYLYELCLNNFKELEFLIKGGNVFQILGPLTKNEELKVDVLLIGKFKFAVRKDEEKDSFSYK